MVQKSGEPVHMVNIPLFIWVLYIPGGDRRISSINSNSHWHNVHHPVLHQWPSSRFRRGDNGDSYFGDASKLLTFQNGFLGIHPRKLTAGTWKSPRFFSENHLNQTFILWVPWMNFQGNTQNGPTKKPRWFTSHQTSTFGCCSCSDFQKVCYPGRAAILSWVAEGSAICCGDTPENLPNSLGVLYCNKDTLTTRSMIYLFHGETSFINFHLPHCFFLKQVTTSIPGVYTHTQHNASS